MFFDDSIASRVRRIIAEKVKRAQEEHDEACKQIEERFQRTVEIAESTRDFAIEDHATDMVRKIIGTI